MIREVPIIKYENQTSKKVIDFLAIEEPLEIQLEYGDTSNRKTQPLSVTMRTPANDEELAIGFLYTEGIISSMDELANPISSQVSENQIIIHLSEKFNPDLDKLKRNFYTTSSCGVCGKESIQAIYSLCQPTQSAKSIVIEPKLLYSLPKKLTEVQKTFEKTGGIHASALFNVTGELISFREDVGRHNALDKLIGAGWIEAKSSDFFADKILLLSGRASFELIQKSAMAGIQVVCAIGAPSSLAVETAEAFRITLVGFLKQNSFNVYSGTERI